MEVASVVAWDVARDNRSEASISRVDGPIDQGKLSNVILVDHAEDGFLLAHVHLRVLNFLLVCRLKLPLFAIKISISN